MYAQIIADLKAAENLPATYATADVGRATGGAAKALLTRVYLTCKDWDNASAKAQEVIKGPYGYDLFANFADVFNKASNDGKEHIFSAQFKGNTSGHGNSLGSRGTPTGIPGVDGGDADIPTTQLYALYQASDKRRDVTFFTSLVGTDGKTYTLTPHFRKYYTGRLSQTRRFARSRHLPTKVGSVHPSLPGILKRLGRAPSPKERLT